MISGNALRFASLSQRHRQTKHIHSRTRPNNECVLNVFRYCTFAAIKTLKIAEEEGREPRCCGLIV